MMNPQALFKIKGALETFRSNHPKFAMFLADMVGREIGPDTIIEVTVTRPGEAPVTSNLKVQQSDIELFETLKDLGGR